MSEKKVTKINVNHKHRVGQSYIIYIPKYNVIIKTQKEMLSCSEKLIITSLAYIPITYKCIYADIKKSANEEKQQQ